MSQTVMTAGAPARRARPDFEHVSTVMLYDIAHHTASVLSSVLLGRMDAAENDSERAHWTARRRLVKQQIAALDPDDRAGLIAQDEVWRLEKAELVADDPVDTTAA